jgi:hypothetical protein
VCIELHKKFDVAEVTTDVAEKLRKHELTIKGIQSKAIYEIGEELKAAHDELASHRNGIFFAWCESIGINTATAQRIMQYHDFICTNCTNKDFLETLPKSLIYEAAKKSAPAELTQKVLDGEITTHKQWQEELKAMKERAEQAERAKEEAERRAEQAEQANEALTVQYDEQAEQLQNLRNNPQVVEVPTGITQEQLDREIKRRTDAEHLLNLEKSKPPATPHDYGYLKRRNAELEQKVAEYKAHEEGMTLQQKAEIDAEVAKYKNTASAEIQKSIKMGDLISAIHNLPKNMEVADFAESFIKQERGAEEQAKADIKKLIIDLQTIHDELDKYINKTERLRVVK